MSTARKKKPTITLSKGIEGFAISALGEGYSPLTIEGYKSSLGTMMERVGDKDIGEITPEEIKDFYAYLRNGYIPERRNRPQNKAPLSTASHHRYWKAVRAFFKWANHEYGIPRPDIEIKMPKFTNAEIVPLTEDEIKALLKACDSTVVHTSNRDPYKIKRQTTVRDKAIILALLDTGVRVGELTRIRVKDVNLETGEVYVQPHHVRKTKPRAVYLGKVARKALWRYLSESDERQPDDPVFLTIDDRPMSREGVLALLKRIGDGAGVKGVHPHRFRHTFAIQYLRNSGDVFTLQRLLGHSTMEMVRHYLALADTDTAAAHRKASPADRMRL